MTVVAIIESLPLRPPSEGWAANWVFWIRLTATYQQNTKASRCYCYRFGNLAPRRFALFVSVCMYSSGSVVVTLLVIVRYSSIVKSRPVFANTQNDETNSKFWVNFCDSCNSTRPDGSHHCFPTGSAPLGVHTALNNNRVQDPCAARVYSYSSTSASSYQILELLPLQPPSEGWAGNWIFWTRVAAIIFT
ncbi:hypothetical protein GQ600_6211 [Phytophthora cactorum]|nr:hypothetical protein GQ600_6211 [Phytophthora cactorum]